MTLVHPPRHTSVAHPIIDRLERTGGLPLVAAASSLVAGVAIAVRCLVPA